MTRATARDPWARLDDLLFRDRGWFCIGADNAYIPGVVVPSREAGMRLIGQGAVTSVVGRVRDGVVVVDVDLGEPQEAPVPEAGEDAPVVDGHAVVEILARWCRERGLWHLVRPSGGAPGRYHLYVVAGEHRQDLVAAATELRERWRLAKRFVDPREQVRPLTAPQRAGGCPRPYGDPVHALRSLKAALRALNSPDDRRRQPVERSDTSETASTGCVEPLVPYRRRRRRELAPEWAQWLATGVRPAVEFRPGADTSRSTWEAMATERMVQAGWTAAEAWEAIATAHPDAMSHARLSYRRWVRWVWNVAVEADDAHCGSGELSPEVADSLAHARAQLRRAAATISSSRERTSFLVVGHTVLDRMERSNALRVPVPQRDLVQDSGIQHRATIASVLERMHGPVGTLHRCFDGTDRERSSFEFEIPDREGVLLIDPPSSHTPSAEWHTLKETAPLATSLPAGPSRLVWLTLRALTTSSIPLGIAEVARHTQATGPLATELTKSQRRTVSACLRVLAEWGLAECDAHGQWSPTGARPRPSVRQVAQKRRAAVAHDIELERAAYRATRSNDWELARAAAIKAQRAKEAAWWAVLSTEELRTRRAAMSARFATLSVNDQAQVKNRLVQRALRVGEDPDTRRQAWLRAQSPDVRARRAQERAVQFATLPPPLRVAVAQAWQGHRGRWGLGRGLPREREDFSSRQPVRVPVRV